MLLQKIQLDAEVCPPVFKVVLVAANHENDTCFWNGLVMGLADCVNQSGLVKTLKKSLKGKLGPLLDTLQAGACIFPPFQRSSDHVMQNSQFKLYTRIIPPSSCLRVNMGCALVILFQVRSFNVPTKDRSPFTGPFLVQSSQHRFRTYVKVFCRESPYYLPVD